jgi:phosphatidylglycerol:prolipoprotein diacylglycerol transferase
VKQVIFDFGVLGGFPLRVFGYGLMLVLGFLLGIALAQWRARRAGEDADKITWLGMISLVGGVLGARLAYVIEQAAKGRWHEFVGDSDPLLAALNITSGGLIYYGGVILAGLLAVGYLYVKRLPVRRYLDIIAPSLLLGLAFGRAGCLLNGCCYGATCTESFALAQHFPMYSTPVVKLDPGGGPFGGESPSPPYSDQFHKDLVTPDERLLAGPTGRQMLIPPRHMHGQLKSDQLVTMFGAREEAQQAFKALAGGAGSLSQEAWHRGLAAGGGFLRGSEQWLEAMGFDSDRDGKLSFEEAWSYMQFRKARLTDRFDADGDGALAGAERDKANAYLQADLYDLARREHSLALKPAQALSLVSALVLTAVLLLVHPVRRREGQVFALALVLYPVIRILEEFIRSDAAAAGQLAFTHNQYTSLVLLAVGLTMLWAVGRLPASAGPTLSERLAQSEARPARRRRS